MKAQLKTISLSLALFLSLSLILAPLPALAASEPDKPSRLTPEEVRAELAETRGQRIPEEEFDLYSKVFSNGDGTNTLTSYSHPVKYVDEKGEIRDISLKLKEEKDGGFRTEQSNILLELPERLSGGIALSHGGVGITMIPKDAEEKDAAGLLSKDRETVTYRVDEATSYSYSPSYTGLREVIEVASYTGRTEYAFTLRTGGLSLREERDGSFALYDKAGARKAALGDVIVFSADERNNTFGAMRAETVRENEEYTVTLLLDPDYLADERTVYPIRIDPDVTLPDTSVGTIEDVTVNNADPISATSNTISAGRYPSDSSLSYILMRFPYLNLSAISNSNQILSATVEIRDLMCQSESLDLECRVYNQSATGWSEAGSPTWWSIPSESAYVGSYLDSRTITYGNGNVPDAPQRYGYNITSLAINWKNGSNSPSKGIVFRPSAAFLAGTAGVYKTFASYNAASGFSPTLTIIYYAGTQSFLVEEGQTYNLASSLSVSGGTVTGWSSTNTSVATVNASGVVTGVHAGYATVKAYVSYANGSTGTINSYVTVTLREGVYTICNVSSLRYLEVQNGSIRNMAPVTQCNISSTSSEVRKLRHYWKIKHLGGGEYSVRPMHKLDMGLDATGNMVDIYTIGTTDTLEGVADYARWTIETGADGYVFKLYGDSVCTMQLETDAATTVGIDMYQGVMLDEWLLFPVTETLHGIILYDTAIDGVAGNYPQSIATGKTKTLADLEYVAAVYSTSTIDQTVTWSSTNTSYATVNASSGSVTGVAWGQATIKATKELGGLPKSASYELWVDRSAKETGQNKEHWCWATAAKMVGEHNGGSGALNTGMETLTYTDGLHSYGEPFFGEWYVGGNSVYAADAGQRQIVIHANPNGGDQDFDGNVSGITSALQFASFDEMEIGSVTNVTSTANMNLLKSELAAGRWVLATLQVGSNGTNHSIVIQGYTLGEYVFTYWDPYTDTSGVLQEYKILNENIEFSYEENVLRRIARFYYCR